MRMLQGRVAVVTGAGSGIGQATALALARAGCTLAIVDTHAPGLLATAAAIGALGARVTCHQTDVADAAQMEALPGEVVAAHGAAHILVNNAGVSLAGPFADYSRADLEWVIGVNLWGVLHGCRVFLPWFHRVDEAHVVTMASDFGLLGFPTKSAYCATKFAVRGFSEALRAELAHTSIGVSCIFPGAVDTGLIRSGRSTDPAKRDREAAFVAERSIGAEGVAARVVRAIRRNEGRVLIGTDTWGIEVAMRVAPGVTSWLVARLARRLPFV
jgi:NADP-dependent 3-hydroxy acid dehydrogenase YdfG